MQRNNSPNTTRRFYPSGGVALLLILTPAWAAAQPAVGPANVSVSQAVQQNTAAGQTFVGTVLPMRRSTVGSAVDGRVLDFLVNEGDYVEKNQPLCQIRTKTFDIQLLAAKAELASRQQKLNELKNGTRPEEIAQAKAHALGTQAMVNYTKGRAQRLNELMQRKATSQEVLDEAISAATKAEQDYLEAQAAYQMAVAGPRAEQIAQAEAQVLFQEEDVHRLEDIIERHRVTAPFNGYIVKEHTEVGQWVKPGDPIVEIVELDQVDIEALVLEDSIRQIRSGTPARVEVNAVPDETFTGEVAVVLAQADIRSRTFPVRVRVKNRIDAGNPVLKSGMFARITLPVGQSKLATFVPKDSVVLGGPQPQVYVVDTTGKQGVVRGVPVQLGVASGGLIEVVGDIKPNQTVVVEGNERLRTGQQVAIVREWAAADLQRQITVSTQSQNKTHSAIGGITDERAGGAPTPQTQHASGL